MAKKILVTGGTGYIGSHTAVALIEQGYQPLLIDNLSNSKKDRLDQIESITGTRPWFKQVEMCNKPELDAVFTEHPDIHAIIHFAAVLQVGESVEKPLFYYRNNLLSTINLLDCMVEHKTSSIVFSSSCTVYGNPDQLPVSEKAPIKEAESPYGNTKKMGEDIIRDAAKANAFNAISLRYFNPIGNHHSALMGEMPHGVPTHLVPYITQTARGIRDYLNIFGNDYNTADGTCIRDYLHVMDLADAHIAAIEKLDRSDDQPAFDTYNIGTGTGFSVLEMVKAFEKATGEKVPYQFAPRRSGDVEAVYADTKKAESGLHWKAKRSLEDMLKSAWDWEQKLIHD